jgi:23S rRNA maturation mini-RNase III
MTPYEKERFQQSLRKWKKKANAFASYYICSFLPHNDLFGSYSSIPKDYFSWNSFTARVKKMESSGLLIDRLRIDAMSTFINALLHDSKQATLISNYRNRCTTRWSKDERESAEKFYAMLGLRSKSGNGIFNQYDEDVAAFQETTYSIHKLNTMKQTRHFNCRQNETLKCLFEDTPLIAFQQQITSEITQIEKPTPLTSCINIGETALNYCKITSEIIPPTVFIQRRQKNKNKNKMNYKRDYTGCYKHTVNISHVNKKGLKYIRSRGHTKSQKLVIMKIFNYFNRIDLLLDEEERETVTPLELHNKNILPQLFLLTGQPGSGKSYVIETLAELCEIMEIGHATCTSYNGIAAVNVDGNTMSSTFIMNDAKDQTINIKLTEKSVMDICSRIDADHLRLLIIDEVSTIDARLLALLDYRLQQITQNNLPFGGIMLLLAGDFNQLGPVYKEFFPTTMTTYAQRLHKMNQLQNPPEPLTKDMIDQPVPKPITEYQGDWNNANKSLNEIRKHKRKNQNTETRINELSPSTLAYKGCFLMSKAIRYHLLEQKRSLDDEHTKNLNKCASGEQLTMEDIAIYPHLTTEDIQTKSQDWKYAPILVATNHQRMNITQYKSKLWAKDNKTYVYKWKTRIRTMENPPLTSMVEKIEEENAFFWQYFVQNAPVNLTTTINGDLALANGTPAKQ